MIHRPSPPGFPQAPVDLMAVSVCGWEVILAWTECGAGGLGFRIERAYGFGSAGLFSEIGERGQHVMAFRDDSLKPRTNYSYRVLAWNATGNSSPSNVAEMTTSQDMTEPPADREGSGVPCGGRARTDRTNTGSRFGQKPIQKAVG